MALWQRFSSCLCAGGLVHVFDSPVAEVYFMRSAFFRSEHQRLTKALFRSVHQRLTKAHFSSVHQRQTKAPCLEGSAVCELRRKVGLLLCLL